jgi:hypothetical protein
MARNLLNGILIILLLAASPEHRIVALGSVPTYNGDSGSYDVQMTDDEEHSQDRKEGSPQDRRERQTLPLRQVPQAQPAPDNNPRTLVLPGLSQRER